MNVYRIHIRPGGTAGHQTTFQYCLKNNVLGLGWRIPGKSVIRTKDWNEYYRKASKIYDKLNTCQYIQKWVADGDLVWTRDPAGQYYLAYVTSGWEYWTSQESVDQDIDIANVFRCDIRKVEALDAVPGKIIACFRAPRAIQATYDPAAVAYSKYLWNELSGKQIYEVSKDEYSDIFMLLDDEETEDVVFMYLQTKDWYVVPNSRKADTMSFEYYLIHRTSHERAYVQVKTQGATLNTSKYSNYKDKVFLFQSKDHTEDDFENVTWISKKEILDFMESNKGLLPEAIQNKLDLLE